MKAEYDFSKGKRGQFFRPEAQINLPIYLEAEVRDYLAERARSKGINLSDLVNDLLRKDIALVEGLK